MKPSLLIKYILIEANITQESNTVFIAKMPKIFIHNFAAAMESLGMHATWRLQPKINI